MTKVTVMTLYRVKKSAYWWMSLVNPRTGKRIRKSTKMKDKHKAQLVEDQLMASLILGQEHYLVKDKQIFTWDMALKRWFEEKPNLKHPHVYVSRMKWFEPHLKGVPLDMIDNALLMRLRKLKEAETSVANANRNMAVIRAILNKAHKEWGWLETMPHVPMQREMGKRIRFLTREEADRLLKVLPEHLKAMVLFSLNTGLRASNVRGLTWEQVNMEQQHLWIEADQAKAKKAIPVPLNSQAMEVLREQQGKHLKFVFTYKGNPIRCNPNNSSWRNAVKKVGLADFRWHDLRHTWATWHIQAGTPLHVLQELGGWHSYDMVQRYAHLTSDHLRRFCENSSRPIN